MNQNAPWLTPKTEVVRTGKDTVFTDLFGIPRYYTELVNTLKPELATNEDDIELVSLNSVLMVKPYNDIGLLVKNNLLVCAEAQSTWSVNILIRLFMYLADTYHRYIQAHPEMNVYGSKKIILPVPCCFLIYTGSRKNCPKILSLAYEFWGGHSPLDLTIKVLTKPGTDNIVEQYIFFCHVFNDQVKLHGRTAKAIESTIEICQCQNVLVEYLTERKKEVKDIMSLLFSQEDVTERYGNACREEGRTEGREEGRAEGREEERSIFLADIAERAKKMFRRGFSLDDVNEFTGLPLKQLQAIQAGLT